MCGGDGVCDNMVRLSSYLGHFAVVHIAPSTLCHAGASPQGPGGWPSPAPPGKPCCPVAVRRLCRMESGTVPTDTALPVNPGSHPFPAAATKLIVTGIHGASVAATLSRGSNAGMDPRFRRQLKSFRHMGMPPPLTPAPQPRGSTVREGEGAVGCSWSVPSVDLF